MVKSAQDVAGDDAAAVFNGSAMWGVFLQAEMGACREKVQQLEQALNDPTIRAEAADVLRSLIDRIELRPGDKGQGIAATLHGDLAQILALCADSGRKQKLPKAETSGSQLSVVAGVGFEPTTFRL